LQPDRRLPESRIGGAAPFRRTHPVSSGLATSNRRQKETTMKIRAIALSLLAALGIASAAHAQSDANFPERPITIVVPYLAGGSSDFHVRTIAEPLAQALGQRILVENRPGASAAIGSSHVARSKPDGYTLLYPNNGLLIAALLNKDVGYDPVKSFTPVSTVTTMPMVLVVHNSLPVSNVAEFINYAKERPGKLIYATAGTGSYGNLATTLFSQMAGIQMTHVPYKGEAGTTLAIRTNEAQVLLTSPSKMMLNLVKEGQLKLLGVASPGPSELVPGTKPINETIPGFTAEIWFGLLAPAGTPAPVVQKINAALRQVLAKPEIREKLLSSGGATSPSTPEAYARTIREEYDRWADVIKRANIKAE